MKLWLFTIILLGGDWSVAVAQTNTQFDLQCTGSLTVKVDAPAANAAGAHDSQVPYSTRLHVDLIKGRFCQDDCKSSEAIYQTQPHDIIFELDTGPQFRRFWFIRDGGLFYKTWAAAADGQSQSQINAVQGQCITAPYTPLSDAPGPPARPQPAPPVKAQPVALATAKAVTPVAQPDDLSMPEIQALIDVNNHRSLSAGLYSHLHALGYLYLNQDIWQLSRKGRAVVVGSK